MKIDKMTQKKGASKGKQRRLKKIDKRRSHKNNAEQSTMNTIRALVGGDDDEDGPPIEITSKGPDMLLSIAPKEESLVEQVLNADAKVDAAMETKVEQQQQQSSKHRRPQQLREGEYVAATDKSKFRLVDMSTIETPTELRANINFRDEMIRVRTVDRRISSLELRGRMQKQQWIGK